MNLELIHFLLVRLLNGPIKEQRRRRILGELNVLNSWANALLRRLFYPMKNEGHTRVRGEE